MKIDTGLGVMPTFVPEEVSCGNRYAGWYEGEMPTEVGQTVRTGKRCFVRVMQDNVIVMKSRS